VHDSQVGDEPYEECKDEVWAFECECEWEESGAPVVSCSDVHYCIISTGCSVTRQKRTVLKIAINRKRIFRPSRREKFPKSRTPGRNGTVIVETCTTSSGTRSVGAFVGSSRVCTLAAWFAKSSQKDVEMMQVGGVVVSRISVQ
jgi:hypothetical protein